MRRLRPGRFRRRAPVRVALAIAAMSAVSGIAAGPATLAAVSVATRRRRAQVVLVGVANFVAAPDLARPSQPFVDDRPGDHHAGQRRGQHRDDGLGPLHRHAPRDACGPPLPGRARRAEQELRVAPGPLDRAGPHRPRDARRAGAPDHPGLDAGGRARRSATTSTATGCATGLGQIQGRPTTRSTSCATCSACCARTIRGRPRRDRSRRTATSPRWSSRPGPSGSTSSGPTRSTPRARADATGRTVYRIVRRASPTCASTRPAVVAIRSTGDPSAGITVVLAQPDRPGDRRCPAPAWAWSGSASAPSCAAAGSTSAPRARRSSWRRGYRGRVIRGPARRRRPAGAVGAGADARRAGRHRGGRRGRRRQGGARRWPRAAPDVVLMDIRMPRHGRPRGDPRAAPAPAPPAVVVLTTFDADDHVVGQSPPGRTASCSRTPRPATSSRRSARWPPATPMLSPSATRSLVRGCAARPRRPRSPRRRRLDGAHRAEPRSRCASAAG